MFYYKLGQVLSQIGAAQLLQNGADVITNWGKLYYKLGQLLQIGAIITYWGITVYCLVLLCSSSDFSPAQQT